jgi:hypothetical protein
MVQIETNLNIKEKITSIIKLSLTYLTIGFWYEPFNFQG